MVRLKSNIFGFPCNACDIFGCSISRGNGSGGVGDSGGIGKGCTKWAETVLSTPEALGQPFLSASVFCELSYKLTDTGSLKVTGRVASGEFRGRCTVFGSQLTPSSAH